MNELKIFENPKFGKIRTVAIGNEPWFVGKDVAEVLGYSDTNKAVAMHIDEEDKKLNDKSSSSFGQRGATLINESGLYSLILSSKLPTAKEFKHWVTSEVLPSIRRTGVYAAPTVNSDMMFQIAQAMKDKESQISRLNAKVEAQEQVIADFEPIKRYMDVILESPGTMATTQIAADYNLSARKLNQILHEAGIQHSVNGQWILYKKHMGCGYTKSNTVNIVRSDGSPDTKMTTRWTQKGRLLIHQTLTDRGIIANMDREQEKISGF